MTVEPIHDLADWEGSDGILAVVIRASGPLPYGTSFVTDPQQSQQVGLIRYGAGHRIPAHTHRPIARTVTMTQEVLFVRKGLVLVTIFNSLRERVAERTLSPGDAIVLLTGGHSFEFVTDAELIECKTGPYLGADDKVKWHA